MCVVFKERRAIRNHNEYIVFRIQSYILCVCRIQRIRMQPCGRLSFWNVLTIAKIVGNHREYPVPIYVTFTNVF